MDKDKFQEIADYHERLSRASSNDALVREFAREIERFGFTGLTYGMVPIVHDPKMEYLSISTLADDWMEHYVAEELFAVDYLIQHCLSEKVPLRWSRLASGIEDNTIDEKFHASYQSATEFRVSKGVTIPIASQTDLRIGMSLVAAHEDRHQNVDRLLDHEIEYLRICAELFHVRIDPRASVIKKFGLSQRNLDIISYVADGLTDKEIAQHLRGSAGNVRDHLGRMFGKMGVHSRAQLVGKARLWNLI